MIKLIHLIALLCLQLEISNAQSVLNTEIHQELMCITNGQVQPDSQNKYDITSATARGVVTTPTRQQAKIVFSYLGPIENSPDNENGHMQIGIKLHAMNSCNVLYAMWPVAGGPIKVSLKRNDGLIYHSECKLVKNQGYTLLTPESAASVPTLTVGAQHTLQAEYDNTTLRVYADGLPVWVGYLNRTQMPFDGPVGFRSDGGLFKHKFYSSPTTPLSTYYNLSSYETYACLPSKPSIKYPSTSYILTRSVPIAPLIADSRAGFISSCTIQPALQEGLVLNPATCAITGTPTTNQSSTAYTITASNAHGSFSAPLSIRVMTPPTIRYSSVNLIYKKGTAVSLTPLYTGNAVESCSVSPALPSGLILSNTCQIAGTPSNITSPSLYQITARNLVGSYTTDLTLEIKAPPVLIYAASTFTFKLGDRIFLSLRSNNGAGSAPTSCTLNRPPPAGTSFNATTCTISGYANAIQGLINYFVTGTNEVGSGSVLISIAVTE